MDSTLLLLIGVVAGVIAARWWHNPQLAPGAPHPGGPPVASDTTAASSGAVEPVSTPTRAERLHRLTVALDAVVQASGNPNEVKGFPEFDEAKRLLADEKTPLSEVLDYARGSSVAMAGAALAALAERPDGPGSAPDIAERLSTMPAWQIQYALEYLTELPDSLPAGSPLVGYQHWWDDNALVAHLFRDYFKRLQRDGMVEAAPGPLADLPRDRKDAIKSFLSRIAHPFAAALERELADPADSVSAPSVSAAPATPSFLDTIGRYWTDDAAADRPIEPPDWTEALADAAKALQRTPLRSLLVSGEPLVGKSSFLRLLGLKLQSDGWRVFEASGADLQAGQIYIGQLEGRIRQAVEELSASKKTIWYVPDLLALALSGTNSSQSASILDQMMPAIASGRLVVWGEASPTAAARLMQMRPAVRRAFELVRLDPLDVAKTLPIARELSSRLAASQSVEIAPGFHQAAVEAAQHYLSSSSLPGSALALMKIAALRSQKARGQKLQGRDVLDALAQLTGLPQSILDGSERLDLAATTAFFTSRVIGQPEAVQSVVERIAMLKSGLNDPTKPFGVFLFAGPTGTGKTELAKAIAEFLFGSIERMIRLDMSEYQAFDSINKIMGAPNQSADADTLASRIRKQPFSLVLLDEFEKSSPNVWDLFLQVFDEGRLTDAYGQTVDFRHCLIILTTNLGATSHQSSGLGFSPRQDAYTTDQVLRMIGQTFRPEFQNRLDKIIVFRPLTREHMRGILKKELDRLFSRRGLKDRDWAVEWEASALEFLLEKGFSPDMGARPLKRAIDQYVVAPLAAAIVERRTPEGEQFVFVRSDGDELKAEFVDPDGDGEPVPIDRAPPVAPSPVAGEAPSLALMMLSPAATDAEVATLAAREQAIAERIEAPAWEQHKASLSQAINETGFWTRADRFEILARYELMDRLAVAAGTARSLQARVGRGLRQAGPSGRELVARLAQQIWLVEAGLKDLDETAPTEAALKVEPVLEGHAAERGAAADWRREIGDMYRSWARRRGMQLLELEPEDGGDSAGILLVSGFGAHRILAQEAGLHVFEQPENGHAPTRIAARVLVLASPPGDLTRGSGRALLADAFARAPRPASVVRRYRREPSPLVRSADGAWRSGKLDAVLAGNFDVIGGVG